MRTGVVDDGLELEGFGEVFEHLGRAGGGEGDDGDVGEERAEDVEFFIVWPCLQVRVMLLLKISPCT